MNEREQFDELVKNFRECSAAKEGGGGCGCMGTCLGNKLAKLRAKYDDDYAGEFAWWSDQGHCVLKVRPGDRGRQGAPLNAEIYWTGCE